MGKVHRLHRPRLSALESGLIAASLVAVMIILFPLFDRGASAATEEGRAEQGQATAATTAALTGAATVSDGDGLRLNGERIRLQGVDAFELHQTCGTGPCGQAARDALQRLVAGRHVACEPVDTDRYGRTIAYCYVDGVDLGEQLVLQGHALAFRRYSREYVDEEAAARRNRAGAWASDFQNPADWRRDHPRG